MKRLLKICAAISLVLAVSSIAQALTTTGWKEYASNPVYTDGSKAYYPTIIKDGGSYTMWYVTSSAIKMATSSDGISWGTLTTCTGLTNANHPLVKKIGVSYRIWYWDTLASPVPYTINSTRTATSTDGVNWSSDQPITQVGTSVISGSGGSPAWRRGSYGPGDIIYNPSGSVTITVPVDEASVWANKFVAYYMATTGWSESIGLAVSNDGVNWQGYNGGAAPVLAGTGNTENWDWEYIGYPTVIKESDDAYHMWYCGGYWNGDSGVGHGIGYAFSTDGINWTRDSANPIFHKDDGVEWRDKRTYTPVVIGDQMWFSGKDADTGVYAIGYALPKPTEVWVDDDYYEGGDNDGHIWGYDAFDNIQEGIDEVSGSKVMVHDGTYMENVNITKAITLEAASKPVIDGGLAGACITIAANGVTIDGFEIKNGTSGIISWDTDNSTIKNCDIHDNLNVGGFNGVGIMFWTGTGTVDFDNNTIADNTIYNNDRQGIYIGWLSWPPPTVYSNGNTIRGNIIYNNGLCIYSSLPDESEYGIQLCFADDNTIQDNEIYGHNDWWFGQGIYLFASYDNTVTGNNIHDNSYGINLWEGGGWTGRSIGNNYINCNAIAGNGFGIWNVDGAAVTVDAEFNWWGSADGPSGVGPGSGDPVSGYVDYDPWLVGSGLSLSYTGETIFMNTTEVYLEATLEDPAPGSQVAFYVDGVPVGTVSTSTPAGVATLNVGVQPVGVYPVEANTGACLVAEALVVVYDPAGGFVTGGGWIYSPKGAYVNNTEIEGKANFGFVSKYKKGANVPTGNTEFVFEAADLDFHSSSYDWLVVTGSDYARFKGTGTINGSGDYKFMLWAGDGEPDTFRIKIWEEIGDVEMPIYDNGSDQPIGGGSIIVHKAKK